MNDLSPGGDVGNAYELNPLDVANDCDSHAENLTLLLCVDYVCVRGGLRATMEFMLRKVSCLSALSLLAALIVPGSAAGSTGYVRMSVGPNGDGASNVRQTDITPDGRFVVFDTETTLISGISCTLCSQVYVHDRDTDEDSILDEAGETETVLVSRATDGTIGGNHSMVASISDDGRYVAFQSFASNLVASDTNNTWDVFVVDRDTDGDEDFDEPGHIETRRVSLQADGSSQQSAGGSAAQISGNGRTIAFAGQDGLWFADQNADGDGTFGEPGDRTYRQIQSFIPETVSLSQTGRYAVYAVNAQLRYLDRDTDGDNVFDESGDSGGTSNVQLPLPAGYPEISANGSKVVMTSQDSTLVENDTNGMADVFLYIVNTPSRELVPLLGVGSRT